MRGDTLKLYPLALAAGLLPALTIHLCYLVSASLGQIEWCLPYYQNCTSISATGREPPAYFLFKGLMIPAAVVIVAYWLLFDRWLRSRGCLRYRLTRTVPVLGVLAGAGLILYTTLLGSIKEVYDFERRVGIVMFFGFTYLAQLLVTYLADDSAKIRARFPGTVTGLKGIVAATLVLGLFHVFTLATGEAVQHRWEDPIEWSFALLLCLHVVVTARMWQGSGYRLRVEADG